MLPSDLNELNKLLYLAKKLIIIEESHVTMETGSEAGPQYARSSTIPAH